MTQANITHDPGKIATLSEIIGLIAANPTSSENVLPILKAAQSLTGAVGGSVVLFDEPRLIVSTGKAESWQGQENQLKALTKTLLPSLQIDPSLSNGIKSQFPDWATVPLFADNQPVGIFWLSYQSKPNFSEEVTTNLQALINTLKIVAANLHLQDRREQSDQLSMSLLHSITDPLLVLDDNRHLLMMNPAAETVFKISASEVRGKPLSDVVKSDELTALGTDETKTLSEWVSPDEKAFMPHVEAVRGDDGALEGWILALRDVTHYKKLNRNQSEFMRIVSHDLRSPLTAMQGFASMMELGLVGELNEKQKHFVSKILAGISQMTALVENIQDAGRYDPESGFYELTRSQCDLDDMIHKIVDNQLIPAEKALTISIAVADNVPIINADAMMIERAIINLVDNAVKYTPSGGKVEVGVKCEKNEVMIMVKDTGLGINAEDQTHLFERHVRIAKQEHKKIKGSGLGLFIVRSVAQRHGGDAWVESEEGKGSTFYLGIPLDGPNLVTTARE